MSKQHTRAATNAQCNGHRWELVSRAKYRCSVCGISDTNAERRTLEPVADDGGFYSEHVMGHAPDGTPTPEMLRPELRSSNASTALDDAEIVATLNGMREEIAKLRSNSEIPQCTHPDVAIFSASGGDIGIWCSWCGSYNSNPPHTEDWHAPSGRRSASVAEVGNDLDRVGAALGGLRFSGGDSKIAYARLAILLDDIRNEARGASGAFAPDGREWSAHFLESQEAGAKLAIRVREMESSSATDNPAPVSWFDYEIDTDDVCTLDDFDGVAIMTCDISAKNGIRMSRDTARKLGERLLRAAGKTKLMKMSVGPLGGEDD